MKRTTITPMRNPLNGRIEEYSVNEEEIDATNTGFGISDAVSDGITFATIIIVLAILLLPLSPIWFFMTRNRIKKIKSQGKTPDKLLLIANTVTKVTFILQIISLCIAVIVGIITLILGSIYLSNNL